MVSCPSCRQKKVERGSPAFPFCSKECRDRDLAGWAEERYKIAGERVRLASTEGDTPHFEPDDSDLGTGIPDGIDEEFGLD